MSQRENYDISEMREYFCTKFCSFVYKTTVQKFAALCCIYLTCAKLTERQTSRTNFATVQTIQRADYIIKVNEWPVPLLLSCLCDVGIIIWFTLKKRIHFSIFQVIIAVRITDLVMGKISYETKMRIQTFHEISLRH